MPVAPGTSRGRDAAEINAPDLRAEKGDAAHLFVNERVLATPLAVVETNKAEIYGRYVGGREHRRK